MWTASTGVARVPGTWRLSLIHIWPIFSFESREMCPAKMEKYVSERKVPYGYVAS